MADYDALWPKGASDPYNLASAPTIERPHGFHPAGSEGGVYLQWNEQKMMAEMQKLAIERKELLRQRAAAEQHVAQCDAKLIALHETAKEVYNQFARSERTHYSRMSF